MLEVLKRWWWTGCWLAAARISAADLWSAVCYAIVDSWSCGWWYHENESLYYILAVDRQLFVCLICRVCRVVVRSPFLSLDLACLTFHVILFHLIQFCLSMLHYLPSHYSCSNHSFPSLFFQISSPPLNSSINKSSPLLKLCLVVTNTMLCNAVEEQDQWCEWYDMKSSICSKTPYRSQSHPPNKKIVFNILPDGHKNNRVPAAVEAQHISSKDLGEQPTVHPWAAAQ